MKTVLDVHQRQLTLLRYPERQNETLQAWDAGDEYLINHVEEMALSDGQNLLILNDNFGALSCWFSHKHHVTTMSDSFISQQGIQANLTRNACRQIELTSTLADIPDDIDMVLMQIPRNNRHLAWQLAQIRQALPEHVPVIAVNKAKEIHTSTLKLFEKQLGTTTTSLAWKKHRLVFSQPNSPRSELKPYVEWKVDGENYSLKNYPNVYSGESLDLGARFMLQHIPASPDAQDILDLGCGNGVLSVKAGQLNPKARLTLVDESVMAVESAQRNLVENLGDQREIHCFANNCLDNVAPESFDLILCNPPFHQQQAVTDHIAWQMFNDAKRCLRPGGQLMVIGNRHLGYNAKLKRLFDGKSVKLLASNSKFVIFQATK